MKTNKEILDQFGQILIEEVYDFNFRIFKHIRPMISQIYIMPKYFNKTPITFGAV